MGGPARLQVSALDGLESQAPEPVRIVCQLLVSRLQVKAYGISLDKACRFLNATCSYTDALLFCH